MGDDKQRPLTFSSRLVSRWEQHPDKLENAYSLPIGNDVLLTLRCHNANVLVDVMTCTERESAEPLPLSSLLSPPLSSLTLTNGVTDAAGDRNNTFIAAAASIVKGNESQVRVVAITPRGKLFYWLLDTRPLEIIEASNAQTTGFVPDFTIKQVAFPAHKSFDVVADGGDSIVAGVISGKGVAYALHVRFPSRDRLLLSKLTHIQHSSGETAVADASFRLDEFRESQEADRASMRTPEPTRAHARRAEPTESGQNNILKSITRGLGSLFGSLPVIGPVLSAGEGHPEQYDSDLDDSFTNTPERQLVTREAVEPVEVVDIPASAVAALQVSSEDASPPATLLAFLCADGSLRAYLVNTSIRSQNAVALSSLARAPLTRDAIGDQSTSLYAVGTFNGRPAFVSSTLEPDGRTKAHIIFFDVQGSDPSVYETVPPFGGARLQDVSLLTKGSTRLAMLWHSSDRPAGYLTTIALDKLDASMMQLAHEDVPELRSYVERASLSLHLSLPSAWHLETIFAAQLSAPFNASSAAAVDSLVIAPTSLLNRMLVPSSSRTGSTVRERDWTRRAAESPGSKRKRPTSLEVNMKSQDPVALEFIARYSRLLFLGVPRNTLEDAITAYAASMSKRCDLSGRPEQYLVHVLESLLRGWLRSHTTELLDEQFPAILMYALGWQEFLANLAAAWLGTHQQPAGISLCSTPAGLVCLHSNGISTVTERAHQGARSTASADLAELSRLLAIGSRSSQDANATESQLEFISSLFVMSPSGPSSDPAIRVATELQEPFCHKITKVVPLHEFTTGNIVVLAERLYDCLPPPAKNVVCDSAVLLAWDQFHSKYQPIFSSYVREYLREARQSGTLPSSVARSTPTGLQAVFNNASRFLPHLFSWTKEPTGNASALQLHRTVSSEGHSREMVAQILSAHANLYRAGGAWHNACYRSPLKAAIMIELRRFWNSECVVARLSSACKEVDVLPSSNRWAVICGLGILAAGVPGKAATLLHELQAHSTRAVLDIIHQRTLVDDSTRPIELHSHLMPAFQDTSCSQHDVARRGSSDCVAKLTNACTTSDPISLLNGALTFHQALVTDDKWVCHLLAAGRLQAAAEACAARLQGSVETLDACQYLWTYGFCQLVMATRNLGDAANAVVPGALFKAHRGDGAKDKSSSSIQKRPWVAPQYQQLQEDIAEQLPSSRHFIGSSTFPFALDGDALRVLDAECHGIKACARQFACALAAFGCVVSTGEVKDASNRFRGFSALSVASLLRELIPNNMLVEALSLPWLHAAAKALSPPGAQSGALTDENALKTIWTTVYRIASRRSDPASTLSWTASDLEIFARFAAPVPSLQIALEATNQIAECEKRLPPTSSHDRGLSDACMQHLTGLLCESDEFSVLINLKLSHELREAVWQSLETRCTGAPLIDEDVMPGTTSGLPLTFYLHGFLQKFGQHERAARLTWSTAVRLMDSLRLRPNAWITYVPQVVRVLTLCIMSLKVDTNITVVVPSLDSQTELSVNRALTDDSVQCITLEDACLAFTVTRALNDLIAVGEVGTSVFAECFAALNSNAHPSLKHLQAALCGAGHVFRAFSLAQSASAHKRVQSFTTLDIVSIVAAAISDGGDVSRKHASGIDIKQRLQVAVGCMFPDAAFRQDKTTAHIDFHLAPPGAAGEPQAAGSWTSPLDKAGFLLLEHLSLLPDRALFLRSLEIMIDAVGSAVGANSLPWWLDHFFSGAAQADPFLACIYISSMTRQGRLADACKAALQLFPQPPTVAMRRIRDASANYDVMRDTLATPEVDRFSSIATAELTKAAANAEAAIPIVGKQCWYPYTALDNLLNAIKLAFDAGHPDTLAPAAVDKVTEDALARRLGSSKLGKLRNELMGRVVFHIDHRAREADTQMLLELKRIR